MAVTMRTGSTRRQRHESVSGRLSAVAAVLEAFDAHVAGLPPGSVDAADLPRLRRVVRALLPLASDDPAFDVTSTVGATGVAVRVHHSAERGLTARIVAGAPDRPAAAGPAGSHVVGELAELLRRRRAHPQ